MKAVFPKRNDDFECSYVEECAELRHFGINSQGQLLAMLRKWSDRILEIDRSPLDDFHIRHYSEELGAEFVKQRITNGWWFSYPALLRIALELEFGEAYVRFANDRDGIPNVN